MNYISFSSTALAQNYISQQQRSNCIKYDPEISRPLLHFISLKQEKEAPSFIESIETETIKTYNYFLKMNFPDNLSYFLIANDPVATKKLSEKITQVIKNNQIKVNSNFLENIFKARNHEINTALFYHQIYRNLISKFKSGQDFFLERFVLSNFLPKNPGYVKEFHKAWAQQFGPLDPMNGYKIFDPHHVTDSPYINMYNSPYFIYKSSDTGPLLLEHYDKFSNKNFVAYYIEIMHAYVYSMNEELGKDNFYFKNFFERFMKEYSKAKETLNELERKYKEEFVKQAISTVKAFETQEYYGIEFANLDHEKLFELSEIIFDLTTLADHLTVLKQMCWNLSRVTNIEMTFNEFSVCNIELRKTKTNNEVRHTIMEIKEKFLELNTLRDFLRKSCKEMNNQEKLILFLNTQTKNDEIIKDINSKLESLKLNPLAQSSNTIEEILIQEQFSNSLELTGCRLSKDSLKSSHSYCVLGEENKSSLIIRRYSLKKTNTLNKGGVNKIKLFGTSLGRENIDYIYREPQLLKEFVRNKERRIMQVFDGELFSGKLIKWKSKKGEYKEKIIYPKMDGDFTLITQHGVIDDTKEVINLLIDVCKDLNLMHKKGFVHFDVKDENVLLKKGENGRFNRARLIDFDCFQEYPIEDSFYLNGTRNWLPLKYRTLHGKKVKLTFEEAKAFDIYALIKLIQLAFEKQKFLPRNEKLARLLEHLKQSELPQGIEANDIMQILKEIAD